MGLKDEADDVAPEPGGVRKITHRDVVDADRSTRRSVEAADQLQQGRLPGARGADRATNSPGSTTKLTSSSTSARS